MNFSKSTRNLLILLIMSAITAYFAGCSDSVTTTSMSDNDYLKTVVVGGVGSSNTEEGDLMSSESSDLDDGGAISDNGDNPITNLQRWGRRVTNVNVNVNISDQGDTIKNVLVTRTITGNYIIIGTVNGNVDTVVKPYTEVLTRTIAFKRIARSSTPSQNWKLYQVSMVNANTTTPEVGTNNITINTVAILVNGVPTYTFQGPNFNQDIFTTKYFGGAGIPEFGRGDQITVVVTVNSNQADTDYVAWHWARNTFGFHRVPFDLISQNGQTRIYQKSITIYSNHRLGVFNGFISANTRKSLFDDNTALFSSTTVGTVYRITR